MRGRSIVTNPRICAARTFPETPSAHQQSAAGQPGAMRSHSGQNTRRATMVLLICALESTGPSRTTAMSGAMPNQPKKLEKREPGDLEHARLGSNLPQQAYAVGFSRFPADGAGHTMHRLIPEGFPQVSIVVAHPRSGRTLRMAQGRRGGPTLAAQGSAVYRERGIAGDHRFAGIIPRQSPGIRRPTGPVPRATGYSGA